MTAALFSLHFDDASFNHTAPWHLNFTGAQELHQQLTFFASVTCDDHAPASASFLRMFAVVVAVGVIIVHLLFPHPGLVGVVSQGLSVIECFRLRFS